MSLSVPPLPSSGQYLTSVLPSCRALRRSAGIDVPAAAVEKLLRSPALEVSFTRLGTVHGINFPLAFPSVKSELNFLGTLALLNFASGYRAPLHDAIGRGAYDTIRTLVMGMYIDSDSGLMSARGWEQITTAQIAGLMNVSLHQEKAHPTIPGLVVGELGGPLNELVGLITKALQETGQVLTKGGYDDLGAFVAEALEESKRVGASQGTGPSPDVILERLVKAIPAFQDMAIVNGQPVYLFKKALFLIHAIALKYGNTPGGAVPVPDTSKLPVFSDNVLPSMLVYLGILDLSQGPLSLREAFPNAGTPETLETILQAPTPQTSSTEAGRPAKGSPSLDGPALSARDAYILRAAAVDACDLIVQAAQQNAKDDDASWRKEMTLPQLDGWLWAVAKDRKDYRNLPRFAERGTVFY
ncbi:hypothetical protein BDV93DRAFT_604748 [Ceratobasidium sp. AG-I]|nr:hypothetical protein BDV93DRAFT_604748 [Ceratobasidium sp. AG-I]